MTNKPVDLAIQKDSLHLSHHVGRNEIRHAAISTVQALILLMVLLYHVEIKGVHRNILDNRNEDKGSVLTLGVILWSWGR